LAQDRTEVLLLHASHVRPEPDPPAADPALDDLLEAGERASADEQDVGGVDLDELLVRVLASALRRDRCRRALQDLEQRLLHALAGDVARDRGVLALPRDLVHLVDVDDAGLGLLDVVVGRLDELQQDVLDVLPDVAGLGERGRVGDREGDVQHLGEGLGEQRLAAPGGAEDQDVGLLQLDVSVLGADLDALVVVVDRDRKDLLGLLLADHVVVEESVDLLRLGQLLELEVGGFGELFLDDLVAEVDALVADVHAGAGDELLHLLLALPAERALQQVRVSQPPHAPKPPEPSGRAPDPASGLILRASGGGRRKFTLHLATGDHLIDHAVRHGLLRGQDEVPVGVLGHLLERLARVERDDLVQQPAIADDLLRLDLDVDRLTLSAAVRLMQEHAGVRQRVPLALGAGQQQHRRGGRRLTHDDGRHVRLDVLHRVVDGEQRRDVAARRVDVQVDVLLRVLGLEVQQLGHDEVADRVVDRRSQEHDPLLEEPGVDVERTLAAAGLLDDHGNEVVLQLAHDSASDGSSSEAEPASSETSSAARLSPTDTISACSTRKSSALDRMISPASDTTWPLRSRVRATSLGSRPSAAANEEISDPSSSAVTS